MLNVAAMSHSPLPSMNALRSFEATARLGSVTRAARELFVTPSAVSHQVRKLEETLGSPLIAFANGRAQLTEHGAMLLPGLSDGFLRIRGAVELFHDLDRVRTLTVVARPFFASRWLSHRLHRFWDKHPEVGLRMRYLLAPSDDDDPTVDASIEWFPAAPRNPRDDCTRLMRSDLSAVCSAALDWPRGGARDPQDIAKLVLLRESHTDFWGNWLAEAGQPNLRTNKAMVLDDGNIRLQACIAGKGIDLSIPEFLHREFAEGLLIEPFPEIRVKGYYYLVMRKAASAASVAFQSWILDEIANDSGAAQPSVTS